MPGPRRERRPNRSGRAGRREYAYGFRPTSTPTSPTGDGLCEEICPQVFTLLEDGLAYVKEDDRVMSDPGGSEGLAGVPDGYEDEVREAAEECPGECIFIEE